MTLLSTPLSTQFGASSFQKPAPVLLPTNPVQGPLANAWPQAQAQASGLPYIGADQVRFSATAAPKKSEAAEKSDTPQAQQASSPSARIFHWDLGHAWQSGWRAVQEDFLPSVILIGTLTLIPFPLIHIAPLLAPLMVPMWCAGSFARGFFLEGLTPGLNPERWFKPRFPWAAATEPPAEKPPAPDSPPTDPPPPDSPTGRHNP
ncbi:MAG: hypothetical protein SFZ03_06505 [Candidatus Melainabacteria bacterium]|nr:hypothetical protein [Candidatus Melainabacteria bacterium]